MANLAKIPGLALCGACLQYEEDCECCPSCGGFTDDHDAGCDEADTKRISMVVRKKQEVRPQKRDFTERTDVVIILDNDAHGLDSTGEWKISK